MWFLEVKNTSNYDKLQFEFSDLGKAIEFIEKAAECASGTVLFRLWKEMEE